MSCDLAMKKCAISKDHTISPHYVVEVNVLVPSPAVSLLAPEKLLPLKKVGRLVYILIFLAERGCRLGSCLAFWMATYNLFPLACLDLLLGSSVLACFLGDCGVPPASQACSLHPLLFTCLGCVVFTY